MKRTICQGLLILFTILLVSCTTYRNPFPNEDLTRESWPQLVDRNPNCWARGADRWFLTGDPHVNQGGAVYKDSYATPAMSTMMVNVPGFDSVKTDGNFTVQIFGTYGGQSVFVNGPNNGVRGVAISVQNGTLMLHQTKDAGPDVRNVIVRIGMPYIRQLTNTGCGLIEGRQIRSNGLFINSTGGARIYLSGCMTVRSIQQCGTGTTSVFGAQTPRLDIITDDCGSVNVSGRIGLHHVTHHGSGYINVIGAEGGDAVIYADGKGKIGIYGHPNIRQVQAKGNTCVYALCLQSCAMYVYAFDNARIGLAGNVNSMFIDAASYSYVGARYLMANEAYARGHGSAHINITASNKIFASATGNSSVYFFGSPNILTQFISGNGTVIPIYLQDPGPSPCCNQRACYKDEGALPVGFKGERLQPRFKNKKVMTYRY